MLHMQIIIKVSWWIRPRPLYGNPLTQQVDHEWKYVSKWPIQMVMTKMIGSFLSSMKLPNYNPYYLVHHFETLLLLS